MPMPAEPFHLGALPLPGGGTRFRVWAPFAERVEVKLPGAGGRVAPLAAEEGGPPRHAGYFSATLGDVGPGQRYVFRLHRDGGEVVERPDPASRHQPQGVHGPSAVVDPAAFPAPVGGWRGLPLADHVLYELHVGTFTAQGTFDAAIPHLAGLAELGVTAVEVMPLAQFPGGRNWGYDGVFPYAVQDTYGGPQGFARFVAAAHAAGLAVVLDVVYNHLGPEGNVLRDFGPYFTDRYATPWGDALNFDGPDSDPVRDFFVANAVAWVREQHVDGLRLDAVHAIVDASERPFLAELAAAVHAAAERQGREVHLFAESAVNTLRFLRPPGRGGCGFDAQWCDDFHHALHTVLTGEREGYYRDFGDLGQLARALRDGFVYQGEYSPYRRRRHGVDPGEISAERLVAFAQNHDQTGNRRRGERLAALVGFEELKLAAGALLLSPFLPLLFMGEEYGETAPFQYFVSHTDPELVAAVRRGRAAEFAAFGWRGEVPDPQAEATFAASRLDRGAASTPRGAALRALHRELLRLRREVPALAAGAPVAAAADPAAGVVTLRRGAGGEVFAALCFAPQPRRVALPAGRWHRLVDSAEERWAGPRPGGSPDVAGPAEVEVAAHAFTLLRRAV